MTYFQDPSPFAACWLRIDRAETHRKAAADVWNAFLEDKPYDVLLDNHGEGEYSLRVIQEEPTPPEMSVLIGEWLYNLRCALDYAVYATAICDSAKDPPPGAGQLQFPCYFTEAQYRQNEYRLKPLTEHHRTEVIELMQPYRHDDPDTSALGWLHKLARIDRHRRLNVMTSYISELSPIVEVPDGCNVSLGFGERVIVDHQAEVARFTVTPWQDGCEVNANPQAGIDPEVMEWADSPFWRRIDYNERLLMLRVAVESVVIPLEYDCTGYSRKGEFLTDGFRAQCNARWTSRRGGPSRKW